MVHVSRTRPTNSRPSHGEQRFFQRMSPCVKVQASASSKTHTSASMPARSAPLRCASPTCAAVAWQHSRTMSVSDGAAPAPPALMRCRDADRQAEADRRDAAPRGHEVAAAAAGFGSVLLLRAGRVVRDDGADTRVGGDELLPQAVAVAALADRRAALVARVAAGNLLGRQPEVVEARLGRDVDAARARRPQQRDALRRRQVHDVQRQRRRQVRQRQDLLDGRRLVRGRPRVEERLVRRLVLGLPLGVAVGAVAVAVGLGGHHLGVEHERRGAVLERVHGEGHVLGRHGGELVDLSLLVSAWSFTRRRDSTYARLDQEALEAADASVDERAQVVGVAGDDAAVEADVDPALAPAGAQLLVEVGDGGGGGDGVEGHVDDGGDAAAGRGARARPEALPLGAAGLVEVDVGVDEARQQQPRRVVDVGGARWEAARRQHLGVDGDDLARSGRDGDGGGRDDERVVGLGEDGARRDEHDEGWRGAPVSADAVDAVGCRHVELRLRLRLRFTESSVEGGPGGQASRSRLVVEG
ncbi:LOW QUALITY PROTEIN: hypothetical protein O9K51_06871 [Purpureocillium lavendulum]|uniref:Uncharacterized protein n=1 Tax=Purpureocillium lavendulum TaxID=1247861 RepID=A0AB34FRX4_9HYPO|nr:LOW QUALITY PROTEIN: hypothetical protein O9K51_06871 [Purpureocillium lavendulum]